MSVHAWENEVHEFREDVNDYSMCLCGIPQLAHDYAMGTRSLLRAVFMAQADEEATP